MSKMILVFFILLSINSYGQKLHSIENIDAISPFYTQLEILELGAVEKIRITHIGDSHIQADFFTGKLRENFQSMYGNAGLGFSFPYKLAKTNGNTSIQYTSNTKFNAIRNIFAATKMPVGLSGYAFSTKKINTALKMHMKKDSLGNTITVLCNNPASLSFAKYNSKKDFSKLIPKKSTKIHRVKKGEYLGRISKKYKVSIKSIQKLNRLKGTNIYENQRLKIPTKEVVRVIVKPTDFTVLPSEYTNDYVKFTSTENIKEMYLFSKNETKNLALYGFILENKYHGVVYNSIGINGAKCADFTKFPLFFKQLSYLKSDLIIISLGTNESFDKLDEFKFIERFLNLITSIKKENSSVSILVTTPPASLFNRKKKNPFIEKYIKQIKENMFVYNYAVWDLYAAFGGHERILQNYKNKLMAKDKIHYTKKGYEQQADLLFKNLVNK